MREQTCFTPKKKEKEKKATHYQWPPQRHRGRPLFSFHPYSRSRTDLIALSPFAIMPGGSLWRTLLAVRRHNRYLSGGATPDDGSPSTNCARSSAVLFLLPEARHHFCTAQPHARIRWRLLVRETLRQTPRPSQSIISHCEEGYTWIKCSQASVQDDAVGEHSNKFGEAFCHFALRLLEKYLLFLQPLMVLLHLPLDPWHSCSAPLASPWHSCSLRWHSCSLRWHSCSAWWHSCSAQWASPSTSALLHRSNVELVHVHIRLTGHKNANACCTTHGQQNASPWWTVFLFTALLCTVA